MILGTGYTALMYAAKSGNINMVNKLVAAGANPNLQDMTGELRNLVINEKW